MSTDRYKINDMLSVLAADEGVTLPDDVLDELTHHVANVIDALREDVRGCSCGMADYGAPGHDGYQEDDGTNGQDRDSYADTQDRDDYTIPGYGWTGWEAETDLDNYDDRPGVHFLTITDPAGEEFATIIHRVSDSFPLDGPVAEAKVRNAQTIVDALNRQREAVALHLPTD